MSLSGSCLCGESHTLATYHTGEPKVAALCHCVDCQKWTGSAYTSNAVVPEDGFQVTKGEPKWYDTIGGSGKNNRHFFCSNCGSSLYGKLDVMPGDIVIKAGSLDNGAANLSNSIGVEFFCKDRVGFVAQREEAKQLPRFI